MICFKCSSENSPRARYCKKCQAVLPKLHIDEPTSGQVALKEGVAYPEPTHHYETEQIQELHELVEGLLDGEDLFRDLEEHLEMMASNYKTFEEQHVRPMQQLLIREASRLPDDDYNTQLSWVLKTGMDRFQEGRDAFKRFFDMESEDPEELEDAFFQVGDGHDFICLGLEMAQSRLAVLQDILENHPEQSPP
jgi:hypothetical protein